MDIQLKSMLFINTSCNSLFLLEYQIEKILHLSRHRYKCIYRKDNLGDHFCIEFVRYFYWINLHFVLTFNH